MDLHDSYTYFWGPIEEFYNDAGTTNVVILHGDLLIMTSFVWELSLAVLSGYEFERFLALQPSKSVVLLRHLVNSLTMVFVLI